METAINNADYDFSDTELDLWDPEDTLYNDDGSILYDPSYWDDTDGDGNWDEYDDTLPGPDTWNPDWNEDVDQDGILDEFDDMIDFNGDGIDDFSTIFNQDGVNCVDFPSAPGCPDLLGGS